MAPDVTVNDRTDGMSTATQLACSSSNEQPDASIKEGKDEILTTTHKACQPAVTVMNEKPKLDTIVDENNEQFLSSPQQISGMDEKPKVDIAADESTEKGSPSPLAVSKVTSDVTVNKNTGVTAKRKRGRPRKRPPSPLTASNSVNDT